MVAVEALEALEEVGAATAQLDRRDRWPENDVLAVVAPQKLSSERWWVGEGAPAGWRAFDPAALPLQGAAYLRPSVIVVNNTPAGRIAPQLQRRLSQYVRELGGALVIVGGERAFGAGRYGGSTLDELSPLASLPPTPSTHWIVLVDASGSMAGAAGSTTRWELEKQAIGALLPVLPADDPLTLGSFSDSLRWWTTGRTVRQTRALRLPPAGVGPSGPTNLQPTLKQLAREADDAMPKQLLLMTDAQTTLEEVGELGRQLAQKRIRMHALAIAPGEAIDAIRRLCRETGGQFMKSFDPREWAESLEQLASAAGEDYVVREAQRVQFSGELSPLGAVKAEVWNRTWLRDGATLLGRIGTGGDAVPAAARWNPQGLEGTVVAVAFAAEAAVVEKIAAGVARLGRDPRFAVELEAGRELSVRVDAADAGRPINELELTLELSSGGEQRQSLRLRQTGPGRYELSAEAPREASLATLREGGQVIDRYAVPGRYAEEFDGIGTDVENLRKLAQESGGRVVEPQVQAPIDFRFERERRPLGPYLLLGGAGLIGLGLLWWRYA